MRLGIDAFQPSDAVVRVALRGLQRCVTHQLLNLAQVGIAVEQMRCKRVSQHVRTLAPLDIRRTQLLGYHPLNRYAREWTPRRADDKRRVGRRSQAPTAHRRNIVLDASHERRRQWHNSLLVALAPHTQHAIRREVADADAAQLGKTYATAIQQRAY